MGYFNTDASGSGELRVARDGKLPRVTAADGVHLHPLLGERLNINVVVLEPGAIAEVHTHDEEQMGYIARGSCTFTDGGMTYELRAGDTYHAPPGTPHGATGGQPDGCTIIDAFSPPRAGLRELLEASGSDLPS